MARREGEQYRLLLERRAVDLGVSDHVEFDDRFLSVTELADLLHATDVFVTPYRNPEQIASGALTFAIAAGCAAISTPYLYAKDILALGGGHARPVRRRGRDRRAPSATSSRIRPPSPRHVPRHAGSGPSWRGPRSRSRPPSVLREAATARPRREPIPIVELELASVRTDHLRTLIDDVGDRSSTRTA